MVTADGLNIDVLELIFSNLTGNDLHSVALVSMSFYDGVLPLLYKRLCYTMRHAKTFPRVRVLLSLTRFWLTIALIEMLPVCGSPAIQRSREIRSSHW